MSGCGIDSVVSVVSKLCELTRHLMSGFQGSSDACGRGLLAPLPDPIGLVASIAAVIEEGLATESCQQSDLL